MVQATEAASKAQKEARQRAATLIQGRWRVASAQKRRALWTTAQIRLLQGASLSPRARARDRSVLAAEEQRVVGCADCIGHGRRA